MSLKPKVSLISFGLFFTQAAFAGSITAPAVIGGVESGLSDPGAAYLNPGALGPASGTQVLVDAQMSQVGVNITATRNSGLDPNTGQSYDPATIDTWVPVFLIGASYTPKFWQNRLTFGVAATDSFVGGGDYLGEDSTEGPFTGHQRYMGVQTEIMSLSIVGAGSLTVVRGLHLGAGLIRYVDSLELLQAADPLGYEGPSLEDGSPYQGDIVLRGETAGGHWGANVGVLFDRFEQAQIGASYSSAGTFRTKGTGEISFPDVLGGVDVPTALAFEMPLPAIVRGSFASQVSSKVRISAGIEYQLWAQCCGDAGGDTKVEVLSEDGDPIGPTDGTILEVEPDKQVPRRVKNSVSGSFGVGYEPKPWLYLVGGAAYDSSAVPDYAVSATNLDFSSFGGVFDSRVRIDERFNIGLRYSKFFPKTRVIDNAAWDVRDSDSPDYVDEHFSSEGPYRASSNGEYKAQQNALGLRLEMVL